MKKSLAAVLASIVAMPVVAADSYTLDSRHTFPSFEVSHLGFSTQRGRFNVSRGKILLDRPAKSGTVEITVETASVDTGLDKLEEHLRAADFFNTEMYPAMTFRSTRLAFNGDALAKVEGELTLLGITRPLALSVSHFRCGIHPMLKREVCGADLTGSIKRSEFGMKYALPAVGDDVKLMIQVEAVNDKAP